ncbi:putative pectinesterase 8 [Nymphaea thermarum]|nr:putative pectinesterase 8 [Nymphaea thermarum]
MNIRCTSLTLASAVVVAVISTLFVPHKLPHPSHETHASSRYYLESRLSWIRQNEKLHHHHHHKHHHHHRLKPIPEPICNDFPPDFPPAPADNQSAVLCVDRNGCCNFTKVQAAIDAVVSSDQTRTIIWINAGIYFEKVTIPSTKPNITLQGQGMYSTAIVWNDTANSTGGTFFSASLTVFAPNFIAKNISFMNVAPRANPGDVGAQAVAIKISGDMAAFWGCGFFGSQDTLHDDKGRHYFRDCFIQGSIDFIFGNGRSLYEGCKLSSIANAVADGSKFITGAITAQGRKTIDDNTGFVFVNCTIGGTGRIWLGRAWMPFSTVIFAYTFMPQIISPDGWSDLNDATRDQTTFYAEYQCTGRGADTSLRVPYLQKLNETQASSFISISYIDGDQWLLPYQ